MYGSYDWVRYESEACGVKLIRATNRYLKIDFMYSYKVPIITLLEISRRRQKNVRCIFEILQLKSWILADVITYLI